MWAHEHVFTQPRVQLICRPCNMKEAQLDILTPATRLRVLRPKHSCRCTPVSSCYLPDNLICIIELALEKRLSTLTAKYMLLISRRSMKVNNSWNFYEFGNDPTVLLKENPKMQLLFLWIERHVMIWLVNRDAARIIKPSSTCLLAVLVISPRE